MLFHVNIQSRKDNQKWCLNKKDDWLYISFGVMSFPFWVSSINEQLSLRVSIVVTLSQEQNQGKKGQYFLVETEDRVGHQENEKRQHFADYNQVLKPSNIPKVAMRS